MNLSHEQSPSVNKGDSSKLPDKGDCTESDFQEVMSAPASDQPAGESVPVRDSDDVPDLTKSKAVPGFPSWYPA